MRKSKRPAEDDGALEKTRSKAGGKRARQQTHRSTDVQNNSTPTAGDDLHAEPSSQSSITRGQKRDREDVESSFDADELEPNLLDQVKKPARKRGRDNASIDHISLDPLCRGHKVGEEWDAGHVRYKVGTDGQRLRRGTVQEVRVKYQMVILLSVGHDVNKPSSSLSADRFPPSRP